MKKIVTIIVTSLLFIGAAYIYITLSTKQNDSNEQIAHLKSRLLISSKQYAKCYNSINYGSYMVGDVSLSHLRFDSTDAEKAHLKSIESDFINTVKKQCNNTVREYEQTYKDYFNKSSEAESLGWIAFLIGGTTVASEQVDELGPQLVRFNAGDPLTYFIFTKQDVEEFYRQKLDH
jgi:hypothetical protein